MEERLPQFTNVEQNDPVENYVYDLMELIPDWQKIEICDY
jgi:hypothetical protein